MLRSDISSISSGGEARISGIISVLRWVMTPAAWQKYLQAVFRLSDVVPYVETASWEYNAARLKRTLASSYRILFWETLEWMKDISRYFTIFKLKWTR